MWIKAVMVAVLLLALWGIAIVWDVRAEGMDDWEEYIEVVCGEYGICPELVQAIIERESSWDPKAESDGCEGLMQISPVFHQGRMERPCPIFTSKIATHKTVDGQAACVISVRSLSFYAITLLLDTLLGCHSA